MGALNNAIVEAKERNLPAAAQLFGVVRDQTEASPFTDADALGLKQLLMQMNERQANAARRAKMWRWAVTFAGVVAVGAELGQLAYLILTGR